MYIKTSEYVCIKRIRGDPHSSAGVMHGFRPENIALETGRPL